MSDYQPICSVDGRVVTVTPIAGAEALDVNVLGAALIGGVFNQGIMVRNVANVWTDVGYFAGNLQMPVLQTDGVNTAAVLATHIGAIYDETQDSLAVSAGCFGHYAAGAATQEMRPLIIDLENGNVAAGQLPQVVLNQNYGYNGATWGRMLIDSDDDNIAAAQVTALNIPLLYGYNPAGNWERLHTDGANSLNVNVIGGALGFNSEYVDDTPLVVEEDLGVAVGGVYTLDPVDLNDFGIFRISEFREQMVGIGYGGVDVVLTPFLVVGQDETTQSLSVASGNYGLYAAAGAGISAYPFLNDLDDGLIAVEQIPQLVVNENYIYSSKAGGWIRWDGELGYAFVWAISDHLDDSAFTVEADFLSTVGGVATDDQVDAGDTGAFRMSTFRNQYVKLTDDVDELDIVNDTDTLENGIVSFGYMRGVATVHPIPIEFDATPASSYSIPVSGHDYNFPTSNTIYVGGAGDQRTSIYDPASTLTAVVEDDLFPAAGFISEATEAFVTIAGGYNSYVAGLATQRAVPDLADLDDDAISTEQIPKLVISETYGFDEDGTGDWIRARLDPSGYWMVHLLGSFLDDSNWPVATHKVFPFGAIYTTDPVDLNDIGAVRMDEHRNLYSHLITEDRVGNDLLIGLKNDVGNNALHTVESKKEIWGDDYLLWYDDMESKAGDGQTTCKWIAAPNWAPFNVGVSFRRYVEGEYFWGSTEYPYLVPPKEGNWMLRLYNEATVPEEPELVEFDAYTKLGLITDKKMSFELWWSLLADDYDQRNYTPITFGFYQFWPNAAYTQYYITKFLVGLFVPAAGFPPIWHYYDNLGNWTPIARDVRQMDSVNPNWPVLDLYCWHYSKLTIDTSTTAPLYLSLTVDDTTYQINQAPYVVENGQEPGIPMSAICPYIYGQAWTVSNKPEYPNTFDQGVLLIDSVKIYTNDLESYTTITPDNFGQHPDGIPGGLP